MQATWISFDDDEEHQAAAVDVPVTLSGFLGNVSAELSICRKMVEEIEDMLSKGMTTLSGNVPQLPWQLQSLDLLRQMLGDLETAVAQATLQTGKHIALDPAIFSLLKLAKVRQRLMAMADPAPGVTLVET